MTGYTLTCLRCDEARASVRLVEHGTDDMALCKECFGVVMEIAEHTDVPTVRDVLRLAAEEDDG